MEAGSLPSPEPHVHRGVPGGGGCWTQPALPSQQLLRGPPEGALEEKGTCVPSKDQAGRCPKKPVSLRVFVSSHILPGGMEGSRETHFPSGIWEGGQRAFPHPRLGNPCSVALRRDVAPCSSPFRQPHLLRMIMSPTTKARAAKMRPPLRTVS